MFLIMMITLMDYFFKFVVKTTFQNGNRRETCHTQC